MADGVPEQAISNFLDVSEDKLRLAEIVEQITDSILVTDRPGFSLDTSDVGMQYRTSERYTLTLACKDVVPWDYPLFIEKKMYDFTRMFMPLAQEDMYNVLAYKNFILIQPSDTVFSSGIRTDRLLRGFSEQVLEKKVREE